MQLILRSARFILPVVFFSYAAVVNLGFARFPKADEVPRDMTAFRGALTAKLDSVYRQSLPHRDPTIGMMGALRYLALGEGRKGVVTGHAGWLFTAEEVRPAPMALDQPLDRIEEVRAKLAKVGTQLVLVPIPGKLDVQVAQGDPEAAAAIVQLYDRFLAGLSRRGIPALDSRAALRTQALTVPAFFRTDTHWTPGGAEAVARALAASGLVPKGSARFSITSVGFDRFTGDLVSFVTSDRLAPLVGLNAEVATPYMAEVAGDGDLDIFAAEDAGATLLIGTSYSANPAWSFAEALKLALGRDVLNLAVEGQGPVRPMQDYLDSTTFREAPPALVIWEFPVRYLTDPTIWGDQGPVKNGA